MEENVQMTVCVRTLLHVWSRAEMVDRKWREEMLHKFLVDDRWMYATRGGIVDTSIWGDG